MPTTSAFCVVTVSSLSLLPLLPPNISAKAAPLISVFDTPDRLEIAELTTSREETLVPLANKVVDVLADPVMHNVNRDVYLEACNTGFTFSDPCFFSESKFIGHPEYVDCAD